MPSLEDKSLNLVTLFTLPLLAIWLGSFVNRRR